MNIIIMKMVSGEDVVAELMTESDTHLYVSKAKTLRITEDMQGQWIPYFMMSPNGMNRQINKSFVVSWFEADDDIAKHYLESVTRIQLLG